MVSLRQKEVFCLVGYSWEYIFSTLSVLLIMDLLRHRKVLCLVRYI